MKRTALAFTDGDGGGSGSKGNEGTTALTANGSVASILFYSFFYFTFLGVDVLEFNFDTFSCNINAESVFFLSFDMCAVPMMVTRTRTDCYISTAAAAIDLWILYIHHVDAPGDYLFKNLVVHLGLSGTV